MPWDEDLADGPTTEGELTRCLKTGLGALAFAVGLARAPEQQCIHLRVRTRTRLCTFNKHSL